MKQFGLILFFLFCFSLSWTFTQTNTLTGIVKDEQGMPLIGASILVADSGTITDTDGYFSIALAPGVYFASFSYVGYEERTIRVDLSNKSVDLEVFLGETNVLLETATITASKFEQRLAESSVSIDVISSKLVESTNTVSIDQVLDKIPGVQILGDQPNIRGGSGWSFGAGSRVLLLINDIPALQGDAGLAQWNDLPVENIAQIEVVKGASSALYGSSALNGVINIRTDYATSDPITKISVYQTRFLNPKDDSKKWWEGSPRDIGVNIMHKQKFGKLDLVVGGQYYKMDSLNTFAEHSFRDKKRVNLNLRYRATDRLVIGANSIFNFNNESDFFLWFNGSSRAYRPANNTVTAGQQNRFSIDPFVHYYDKKNNKHSFNSRWYSVDNNLTLNQSNSSDLYFAEYQFQKRFEEQDITLITGVSTTQVHSNSEVFSDTLLKAQNYAYYLQAEKKFDDKLNFSLGLRYEYNQNITPEEINGVNIPNGKIQDGRMIGRFGLNYELGDYSFLRASYGQGYRFPTIAERFLTTRFAGTAIFPNPELEPETGWSAEIGIKNGVKLGEFVGFLDFAMFISEYTDMMEFTFVNINDELGFQSQNIGNTRIRGFELGLSGKSTIFELPITLFGGYTYVDPKYQEFTPELESSSSVDYNILKYRTKHHLTFDVQAEYKSFALGAALVSASNMEAIDKVLGSFATIGNYRDAFGSAYKRFDLRLAYTLDSYKLSVLLNNLLNEEYTERPAYLEPPRNVGVRLDVTI